MDDQGVWVGNVRGKIFRLDPEAKVLASHKLRGDAASLTRDGEWIYAVEGENTEVYDLTGPVARLMYSSWELYQARTIAVRDGWLAVVNARDLVVLDQESKVRWKKSYSAGSGPSTLLCDDHALYVGHARGVSAYSWSGKALWSQRTRGEVRQGCLEAETLSFVTGTAQVVTFSKKGAPGVTFPCDKAPVTCAVSLDGRVFVGGEGGWSVASSPAARCAGGSPPASARPGT